MVLVLFLEKYDESSDLHFFYSSTFPLPSKNILSSANRVLLIPKRDTAEKISWNFLKQACQSIIAKK